MLPRGTIGAISRHCGGQVHVAVIEPSLLLAYFLVLNPMCENAHIASLRRFVSTTMSKVSQPELKRFLEKRIIVNIQGGRKIQGTLRGYDLFLNLVVDDAVEQVQAENNQNLWKNGAHCGTVVRFDCLTN